MGGVSDTRADHAERYRILGPLGSGGMGEVLRGVHVELGREVAIKRLKSELSLDQSVLKRFENEARAVNLIRHENIVEVTDFYSDADGQVHMVMELLKGRSLGDLIRTSAPLPIERVAHIGAQIADALGAAHEHGVIHRDLKPENVFLIRRKASDDYVKLLDFGIARLRPECGGLEATESGLIIGTPVYMSPEQAKGTTVEASTDMYSFGVLLYEMVSGQWPFSRSSAVQMMMAHIADEPKPLDVPELPGDIAALISQCLAKEPSKRPQSMKGVCDILERWAEPTKFTESEEQEVARGLSDTFVPPSEISTDQTLDHSSKQPRALSEEEKTASRRPSSRALTAIVLVLGLGAIAGWWLIRTRNPPAIASVAGDASQANPSRLALNASTTRLGMPIAPAECQTGEPATLRALVHVSERLAGGTPGIARAVDAAALEELAKIGSDMSPELLLWRARANLHMGDVQAAIHNARLAQGSCQAMAAAHATEGTAQAFQGNHSEAIEKLQAALELDTTYVDARFNLAISQLATQQLTAALGNLSLVIEQSPTLPGARYLRGQCALQLGDATAAAADLEVAVREEPASANAWYALGFALQTLGREPESKDAYCKASSLGDTRAPCDDVPPSAPVGGRWEVDIEP